MVKQLIYRPERNTMAKTTKVSTKKTKRNTSGIKGTRKQNKSGLIFKNSTYDILKVIAQIWLPAIATLWVAVSLIWNLPLSDQIEQTITAIIVFLDTILGLTVTKASSDYHKGDA